MSPLSKDDKSMNIRFLDAFYKLKKMKVVKNKAEFCSRINMPAGYISFFEKEERGVPALYIDRVSQEFNISKDWLLTGEGEMLRTAQPGTSYAVNNTAKGNANIQAGQGIQQQGKGDCEQQLQAALKEIEYLKQMLMDKERIITLISGGKPGG